MKKNKVMMESDRRDGTRVVTGNAWRRDAQAPFSLNGVRTFLSAVLINLRNGVRTFLSALRGFSLCGQESPHSVRRFKACACAAVFMLAFMAGMANADTVTVGEYTYTYNVVNGGANIQNGTSCAVSPAPTGAFTIPSTLAGYPVTSIGDGAFRGCSGLTGVTIPSSVTSIGDYAFYNCSGLTGNLTIPEGVTSIGNYAFWNCSGLTDNLTIPSGVTSIGYSAFSGCSKLTSVTIPEGVTSIGGYAFYNCTGLTGNLTIPSSVTSFGDYAFYGCSKLTSVTISEGITSIGNSAFSGCSGLTGVTIPSSVTSIGNFAFSRCSGLMGVTIPSGVTSIGNSTFYDCIGLLEVYFMGNAPSMVGTSIYSGTSTSLTTYVQPYSTGWDGVAGSTTLPALWNDRNIVCLTSILDDAGLPWETGGDRNWFVQTETVPTDSHVIRSGAIGDNQSTWIETTVSGQGTLSFWWKVSSEEHYDWLTCYTNGVMAFQISGEVDWEQRILEITGETVVRWEYAKDNKSTGGDDCGWLDGVVWTPIYTLGEAVNAPELDWQTDGGEEWIVQAGTSYDGLHAAQSGAIGDNQSTWIETTVTKQGTLSFWWKVSSEEHYDWLTCYTNGVMAFQISGEVDWEQRILEITGETVVRWEYAKDNKSTGGEDCGWLDGVVWTPIYTLGEAVNAPELDWQTDGGEEWIVQEGMSYDGLHAAQSGAIGDNTNTWISTTVTGPGTLSFWWKVSSEVWDVLAFKTNGVMVTQISGEQDWAQVSLTLPAGEVTVRWEYTKDKSDAEGEDCAWLDGVTWTPAQMQTDSTPVPVPYSWLDQWQGGLAGYQAYEDFANSVGANGYTVWESYEAGLDPTNAASKFRITNFTVKNVNGTDTVTALTWTPNYENDPPPLKRDYIIEGKTNLTDTAWHSPTNSGTRFFRVKAKLP